MSTQKQSITLYICLILVAILILSFSFFFESRAQINARLGLASPTPSAMAAKTVATSVPQHGNYPLMTPGLLPNHPLYPLKMIRDRITLILTLKPSERPAILLNYADKRISATDTLISLGYANNAIGTAMKAESYLGQAINSSDAVDEAIKSEWFDTLKRATLKHEEVIERLRLNATDKTQADKLYENLSMLRSRIVTLSGTPFGYVRPEDNPR